MDNDTLIGEMLGSVEHIRTQLQAFEANQDENSDEGNSGQIDNANVALDDLEGAIGDLVP